jgi:hypothetical protein
MAADNPSIWQKWQITTEALQVWAIQIWVCNDMAKNIYYFWTTRAAQYGTWILFTYAAISNILSRTLSITNIYNSLLIAT